jgi:hypothetical protein
VPQVHKIRPHARLGYVSVGRTKLVVASSLTPKSARYVSHFWI